MKLVMSTLLTAAIMLTGCATALTPDTPQFTRAEIEEDYEALLEFVTSTHPDLARSADFEAIGATAQQVRASLPAFMSLPEAWMAMAVVNPLFGDAHTGLRRPVAAIESYQDDGGRLFPAPVTIGQDGILRIAYNAEAEMGAAPGAQILEINNIDSQSIVARLAPRMRGETPELQRLIMERYFAEYYWLAYGGFEKYRVRIVNQDGTHQTVTLKAGVSEVSEDPGFRYERLDHGAALLTVPTFDLQYRAQFAAFLERAFEDIHLSGANTLMIDLRDNGGGARDLSDLLIGYLSSESVATTSRITARVTEENAARLPGASLGTVVTVPLRQMTRLASEPPKLFEGRVYVLIGKLTYSQAVVFAATVQDNDLAVIAGEETEGPANQTAQVQSYMLPHTGLEVLAPLYVFTRASGEEGTRGLVPDIGIKDDPADPARSVEKLLALVQAAE